MSYRDCYLYELPEEGDRAMSEQQDVKRYDCGNGNAAFCYGCYAMEEDQEGDWVAHKDYAALQQRIAEQAAKITEYEHRLGDPRDTPTDTGNPDIDRVLLGLSASDPDFDVLVDAAALLYRLAEDMKGPEGYATWKDAAVSAKNDNTNLRKRIATLEAACKAGSKLSQFRNIPCSGDTFCGTEECGVISHNRFVFKTKEALDAYADYCEALRAAGYPVGSAVNE